MTDSRLLCIFLPLLIILIMPLVSAQEPKQEIEASEILGMISNGQDVIIEDSVITGDLDFMTLPLEDNPEESGNVIRIKSFISIRNSRILGKVNQIQNNHNINLIFELPVIIQNTSFTKEVDLSGSRFTKFTSFTGSIFESEVNFDYSIFSEEVDFVKVKFEKRTSFQRTVFNRVDFSLSEIKDILFSGVTFNKVTSFQFAKMHYVTFDKIIFMDLVDFSYLGTNITYFIEVDFKGIFIFRRVGGIAKYDPENLSFYENFFPYAESIVFERVTFYERVIFTESRVDNLGFGNCLFLERVDFTGSNFIESFFVGTSFEEVDFTKTFFHPIRWDATTYQVLKINIIRPHSLENFDILSLKDLENNFRALGRIDLANEVYYNRMIVERETKFVDNKIELNKYNSESYIINLLMDVGYTLETILLDWPFGYGVRPLNAFGVSTGFILFFSIFYYYSGTVRLRKPRQDQRFSLRLTDIPVSGEEYPSYKPKRRNRIWDAVSFSFSVYTKLGTGRRFAKKLRKIVIFEWILGTIMMAGLLYTLVNTVPALQQLLAFLL